MTEPKRWTEGTPPEAPTERRLAAMLREAVEIAPPDDAAQERMLREVQARAASTPHRAAPRYAFAAAAALGLLVVGVAALHRARQSNTASHLNPSPDAQVRVVAATSPSEADRLEVDQGLVEVRDADATRAVNLQTPNLSALVKASSYLIQVAGERTLLVVMQGEAWIGTVVRVHLVSGQSIRSDDPRLQPAPPSPATVPAVVAPRAQPPSACADQATTEAKHDCYLSVAMGNDQAAQNALFQLGIIDAEERHDGASAIVVWRAYERRFPLGSLAPEASYSIVSEYLTERRAPEALTEATSFLARYPADPRGAEVRLATASLACAVGDDANAGLALLDAVLVQKATADRGEALLVSATCHDRLGHATEAAVAARTYLQEFPNGPHVEAMRVRLAH